MNQQDNDLFEAVWAGDAKAVTAALDTGADVKAKDKLRLTPLHLAAEKGLTDIARLLIEKGANVNAKDEWQFTPLHFAAMNGQTDLARLLIEKGGEVNARNKQQDTPLQLADRYGHAGIVNMLKDAVKDQQQGHAGRVAKQRGSAEPQVGG